MRVKEKILRLFRILRVTLIRRIIHLSRKIKIPGFEGISLWEILFFFVWSIRNGYITTRASSLAFHFFLAMIPFGLLLVVLSSQLHFFDLRHEILPILGSFIPESLFHSLFDHIKDFENSSVSSLISFGFLIALFFTSNGFNVLIKSFNSSRIKFDKRKWWSIRLTALGLVIMSLVGIVILFMTIMLELRLMNYWKEHSEWAINNEGWIFGLMTFITTGTFLYFAVSVIYYMGPSNRKQFRFFSAGATLSTALIILISEGYSLYISYVSNYDELYGSLATIMILLLWIYLISLVLLLGFELNASIHGAVQHKKLSGLESMKKRYSNTF